MNAMTNALKEAGMKTPTLNYRIWNWLKDHPEKTAEEITKALNLNYSAGVALLDMYRRGMLTVYKDKSRKAGLRGIQYMVKRYSVANPREFELLPMPKTHNANGTTKQAPKSTVRQFVEKQVAPVQVDVSRAPTVKLAAAPKAPALTEAEKFAAFLEFKQLMKEMSK